MARTAGSKNTNSPSVIKNMGGDSEDLALAEFMSGLMRWKAKAAEKKDQQKTGAYEMEIAEAYRLLLNRFSNMADETVTE